MANDDKDKGTDAGQEGQSDDNGGQDGNQDAGAGDDKSLNAQAKELSWVKDLMAQAGRLKKLEAAEAERKDADAKAKREAEVEKAKSEERYEDALALQKTEFEAQIATQNAQLQEAQLKSELASKGFSERGIALISSEYNAEAHGTIADYAAAAAANEGNAIFLNTAAAEGKPAPPTKVPTGGTPTSMTGAQLEALENSSKPEERMQAITYKEAWYEKHGSFDGMRK
jgi:hypothetical protein